MSDPRFMDHTYRFLGKALDVSSRRHNLITTNISNMDTIGFKPRDLDFQKTLEKAMTRRESEVALTHPRHLSNIEPIDLNGTQYDPSDLYHLDTVDIDTEMGNLVENNIKYRTTAEMMIRKVTLLKHVITEGGR